MADREVTADDREDVDALLGTGFREAPTGVSAIRKQKASAYYVSMPAEPLPNAVNYSQMDHDHQPGSRSPNQLSEDRTCRKGAFPFGHKRTQEMAVMTVI